MDKFRYFLQKKIVLRKHLLLVHTQFDSTGGLLDILVLLGPSPEDVAKQASAALGR